MVRQLAQDLSTGVPPTLRQSCRHLEPVKPRAHQFCTDTSKNLPSDPPSTLSRRNAWTATRTRERRRWCETSKSFSFRQTVAVPQSATSALHARSCSQLASRARERSCRSRDRLPVSRASTMSSICRPPLSAGDASGDEVAAHLPNTRSGDFTESPFGKVTRVLTKQSNEQSNDA
jgi:hypothetical protein